MDELTRSLLAARGGDRSALARFVRASQADVWRFCAHLVDVESADDLTQDVYVRALRAVEGFRGEASARTWLLAIARRTCADEIRRRQRRRRRDASLHRDRDVALGGRRDHVAEGEPDHAGELALDELIASLGDDRRAAFVLTQVLGLGYAEAAATCEVPIGTIRSRVARAREDLIAMLASAEHGTGT